MNLRAILVAVLMVGFCNPGLLGQSLPEGFAEHVVLEGLELPTNVEFAADGRIFIAEKSGVVKVFDNLDDRTPTVFADLQSQVYNIWDRGLIGLAVHPDFPDEPYVYVLYTLDAPIGQTPPVYGDQCGDPLGQGCLAGARLSRLTADGNVMSGPEEILIEDWCQQYPSHSIVDLEFGLDGALYVSGGDGASFTEVDQGQHGNPCSDPPGEGGALRSQDLETDADAAVTLAGAILRVDPATGQALPDNPLFGGANSGDDRIIAYGLRNPFRIAVHPQNNEVWVGDVGWNSFEEIHRVVDPVDTIVENFGWPCYEGEPIQPGYDGSNIPICENLYASPGSVSPPVYAYHHSVIVAPGPCGTGASAVTGLAFYDGGSFPKEFGGALFFSDYTRSCIWVMYPGMDGVPDPETRETFVGGAGGVVDLERGPGGDLFYLDLFQGSLHRVQYVGPDFIRGDANGDGDLNLGDPIFTLNYYFNNGPNLCSDAQDSNDDGDLDVADPIYSINYLFAMGPPPLPPFGSPLEGCGFDPTPDGELELDCATPPAGCR